MLTVHWPYAPMVTPAHVSASVKSPAALPVIATLLIVRRVGSGLTTSTVWTALVVPTRCRPKSTASALSKLADGPGDGVGGVVVIKHGIVVRNAMGRGITVGRRVGAAVAGGVAVRVGGIVAGGVAVRVGVIVAGGVAVRVGGIVGRGAGVLRGRAVGVVVGRGASFRDGRGMAGVVGRGVGVRVRRGLVERRSGLLGCAVGVTVGRGVGVAVGRTVGVAVGRGRGVAVGTGRARWRRRCRLPTSLLATRRSQDAPEGTRPSPA